MDDTILKGLCPVARQEDAKQERTGGGIDQAGSALDMFGRQTERVRKEWRKWALCGCDYCDTPPIKRRTDDSSNNKHARQASADVAESGSMKNSPLGNGVCKKSHSVGCISLSEGSISSHLKQIGFGMDRFRASIRLIHRKLYEHRLNRGVFNVPVDPVKLRIPTYLSIIKNPMDLGTIKNKIDEDLYISPSEVADDIRLVFNNAMKFNHSSSGVFSCAKSMLNFFESMWLNFEKEIELSESQMKAHECPECCGVLCAICGLKCIKYQEPVLRCSAPCKARIVRGTTYYRLGGDRGQHWCCRCYSALPERFIGFLGQIVRKSDIEKAINDEVFFESWITCSCCGRRLHQNCALYHPLLVADRPFVCILCVKNGKSDALLGRLDKKAEDDDRTRRKKRRLDPCDEFNSALPRAMNHEWASHASSLPHTLMGQYLENKLHAMIRSTMSNWHGETEEIIQATIRSLTLRVVSSHDFTTHYESRILRWIQAQQRECGNVGKNGKSFSDTFPCRCKTVSLFQKRDGVDLLIFVLYVQEYGKDAPFPNTRKVYVSYLDSVAYLQPRNLRTPVFQEILVAYLTWVAARGFTHSYIWACPPHRGDAYVMHCHPRWQRTPNVDRLRKWYEQIIEKCREVGIIADCTNFYQHHLSCYRPLINTRRTKDFDGELVLESNSAQTGSGLLQEGDNDLDKGQASKMSGESCIKSSYESLPYFYGDYLPNETEAILNGLSRPPSSLPNCDRSIREWWLSVWNAHSRSVMAVKQEIEDSESRVNKKILSAQVSGESQSGVVDDPSVDIKSNSSEHSPVLLPSLTTKPRLTVSSKNLSNTDELQTGKLSPQKRNEWLLRRLATSVKPMAKNFIILRLRPPPRHNNHEESTEGEERHSLGFVSRLGNAFLVWNTTDPDPALPSGIFDSRLDLLDLCKFKHLQFDELRRAKVSSMVLLQLHCIMLRKNLIEKGFPVESSHSRAEF